MTSLMIKGLQVTIEQQKADIEYWKHCAEFGSLSGKIGLEQVIESQKQIYDALVEKLKIATDALRHAHMLTAGGAKAIIEQALSQIQQQKS